MRVWTYPDKTWNELGAERWTVEWHTVRPGWKDDGDSPDPDVDIISHYSVHPNERAAKRAAQRRIEADFYGCPIVQRQVVDWYVEEDRIAEWADVGEPVYVS